MTSAPHPAGRTVLGPVCAAMLWLIPALSRGAGSADDGRLYSLPVVGSYELPVIDRVSRHELLSDAGERVPLLDLDPAQCAVVSFVYASCPDAGGCPLVLASLRRVDQALAERSDLASRVQLVTVSLDPVRDTPEQMKRLRSHLKPRGEWRFLTAESDAQLRPVLEDFGQDSLRLVAAEDGRFLGVIRHIAKVFLLDSNLGIRNVYSSGFLDYEILLRDIETLLLEEKDLPGPH